jgi:hypothetical protein
MVTRANVFRVGQPVFSKLEGFFPIQEIETVIAGFFEQFCKLSRWHSSDQAFGVDADAEKHFILDDIAHSGKDVLIEQGIGGQFFRAGLQLFSGFPGIPGVAHHIGAPIILRIDIPRQDLHRAGEEIQIAGFEFQVQPWRGFGLFIDAVGAEKQEVDSDRLLGQDDQEMLAPAFERGYFASRDARQVDSRVAVYLQYLLTVEFLCQFFQYDDRWTLGHTSVYANDEPLGPPIREKVKILFTKFLAADSSLTFSYRNDLNIYNRTTHESLP